MPRLMDIRIAVLVVVYLTYSHGQILRLSGGTRYDGIVEIFYNGAWQVVCDYGFQNATGPSIICQMLGLSKYGSPVEDFKDGVGKTIIVEANCRGGESSLSSCRGYSITRRNCSHYDDAGISCGSSSLFTTGRYLKKGSLFGTKLIGGSGPWEGIVQMRRDMIKGTVCSQDFDDKDATVICRYLGYSPLGSKAVDSRQFSSVQLLPVYNGFNCMGSEDRPELCSYGKVSQLCNTTTVAAVKCKHTNIRLVNGTTEHEGRLEVQNEHGVWGTVCDRGFDIMDANVVCKMLGFGDTSVEIRNRYSYGSGKILFPNLNCKGSEMDISACEIVAWNGTCDHRSDVGINCKSTKVRLVGQSPFSGRLEVFYNGTWGTVCDNGFSSKDAAVVCRALGFEVAGTVFLNAHFGKGRGKVLLEGLNCNGFENDFSQCWTTKFGQSSCSHSHDVGVTCLTDFQVRLRGTNRRRPSEGRLEIHANGIWYGVCDDNFEKEQADAVCRYLGYQKSTGIVNSSKFGKGTGKFLSMLKPCSYDHVEGFKCIMQREYAGLAFCYDVGIQCGTLLIIHEDELFKSTGIVNSSKFGKGTGKFLSMLKPCSYDHVEGFKCIMQREYAGLAFCYDVGIQCEYSELRLVNGPTSHEGRVEVKHNGEWGSVCCQGFDIKSGEEICKLLGFKGQREILLHNNYGKGAGPVWVPDIHCIDNSTDIYLCVNKWNANSCTQTCAVGLKCINTPVRLVDGTAPFQGKIEVQHNNKWGGIEKLSDGDTICRMMNYNMSDVFSRVSNNAAFGQSGYQLLPSIVCDRSSWDIEGCLSLNSQHWHQTNGYSGAGVQCLLKVRLADGLNGNSGRVEVMRDGTWGTLCSSRISDEIATEFCKMATFPEHTIHVTGKALPNGFYGPGKGPIWKLNDGCINDVARCFANGAEHKECAHANDVSIYCDSNTEVMLTNGAHPDQGTINIKYQGQWVGMCDSSWDSQDASTICKTLGYWVNSATPRSHSWFGKSNGPMWDLQPRCNENDNDLALCIGAYQFGKSTCARTNQAGVHCVRTNIGKNSVRLVQGPGPWNGKVEIEFAQGKWGSLCWSSWNSQNTDVVCKTLQYRSGQFGEYAVDKNHYPILMNSLNCSGSEDNIGLCSGDYNVENCSNEAVGIDCSGDVNVRLVGGSNPYEGRVEVLQNGKWKSVCDINMDRHDARTVCSMLGLPNTSPNVLRNGRFGTGGSGGRIDDLGCIGWEDHLNQCNINNSGVCQLVHDSAIQCITCFHGYRFDSGHFSSPNYPLNYSNPTDCVYTIEPKGNEQLILLINDLDLSPGHTLEVKEGQYGKDIAILERNRIPSAVISGSKFLLRFKSSSGKTGKGFQLSWRPLSISDAITVGCGSDTWDMTVNMTILRQIYNDSIEELLYFPHSGCRGKWRDDSVVFTNKYTECQTQTLEIDGDLVYRNTLMYPEASNPNPIIVRHFRWEKNIACRISKTNNGSVKFHPLEHNFTTLSPNLDNSIVGTGREKISIHFFSDPHFYQEVKGDPVNLQIGENVYVKVNAISSNDDYKMVLQSCYATPGMTENTGRKYLLIKDGCETDPTTHIISQTIHETRFYFNAFEFQQTKDSVYITCSASFCQTYDQSDLCQLRCQKGRRRRSVVTEQENIDKVKDERKHGGDQTELSVLQGSLVLVVGIIIVLANLVIVSRKRVQSR